MIKVGDKVRTTKQYDNAGVKLFPVGTIGTVGEKVDGKYMIEANGDFWWYTSDMFEKAEEKPMTRDDLKDGMICITRCGNKYMWLYGELRRIKTWCSDTQKNLKNKNWNKFDITKIYEPIGVTIEEMLDHDYSTETPIWERKEPKKMTVAEIEAALGYPVEITK